MSYTVEDLDAAITNEETPWEGSWNEFEGVLSETHEWVDVPEGTEGATFFDWENNGQGAWQKNVPLAEPGASLEGIGRAVMVEQFGGEGRGDTYWLVFKVIEADGNERLFKRDGWYASFHGSDLEGPTEEVEQAEKTVTYYKAV